MSQKNDHLKKLRIKCGYTQQQVADVLGVTKSTISKYESGQRKLKSEHIEKLSILFNVEPVYILLGVTTDEWRREMDNIIEQHEQEEREYWESVLFTEPINAIIHLLDCLNDAGQQKLITHTEDYARDLAKIPEYRRQKALEPPPPPSDSKDTPAPPEGTEGPQKPEEG